MPAYSVERVVEEVATELAKLPSDLAWDRVLTDLRARGVGKASESKMRSLAWARRREMLIKMSPHLQRARAHAREDRVAMTGPTTWLRYVEPEPSRPAWMDDPQPID